MPVISTRVPSFSRPSRTPWARQSGIEAEDVFPKRSTFTKTFYYGMPSFDAAWSMIRLFAWCGT
jgi:hypothetical protein